jgi:hypothetical protein
MDVTLNVYIEVSDAKTLRALKAARQTAMGVGPLLNLLLYRP